MSLGGSDLSIEIVNFFLVLWGDSDLCGNVLLFCDILVGWGLGRGIGRWLGTLLGLLLLWWIGILWLLLSNSFGTKIKALVILASGIGSRLGLWGLFRLL